MIHLSDIRKYEKCEALLWQSKHDPQPYFPFLHPSLSMRRCRMRLHWSMPALRRRACG